MSLHKSAPRIRIINHHLMKEVLGNFGVCIFIFTFTVLMSQVFKLTEMVINKGFGLGDTFKFLGFLLPSLLTFIIPMSFLLGILFALGRMSADGEVIALKASGISLAQILRPVLLVALIAFSLSSFFTLYLSPQASHALRKLIFDIAKNKAEVGIKEGIFNSDFEGLMLYVNHIPSQGGKLEGVIVSDLRQTKEPSTIFAQEGYLTPHPEELEVMLQLQNGSIHRLSKKNKSYQKIDFDTYNLKLDLQEAAAEKASKGKKRREMSTAELWHWAQSNKIDRERYYLALVDLHSRFATPFACLVFGLLAVPFGIFSPRAGRAYGFIISLGVILTYYILFSFGSNISTFGVVHPMVAVWFPNFFFFVLSLYLFQKAKTESPIMVLEKFTWYLEVLKIKLHRITEGVEPEETDSLASIVWDINNSSKESLMLKLGIGEKKAAEIVTYRERQGGIKDLEELKNIRGISDKTFQKIKANLLG